MRVTTADQTLFNTLGWSGYVLWYRGQHGGDDPPHELLERLYARSRRTPAMICWWLFTGIVNLLT